MGLRVEAAICLFTGVPFHMPKTIALRGRCLASCVLSCWHRFVRAALAFRRPPQANMCCFPSGSVRFGTLSEICGSIACPDRVLQRQHVLQSHFQNSMSEDPTRTSMRLSLRAEQATNRRACAKALGKAILRSLPCEALCRTVAVSPLPSGPTVKPMECGCPPHNGLARSASLQSALMPNTAMLLLCLRFPDPRVHFWICRFWKRTLQLSMVSGTPTTFTMPNLCCTYLGQPLRTSGWAGRRLHKKWKEAGS